jgi:stress response protein YsnF
MLSERELTEAIGTTAYGPDGGKIGTVEHFFLDDRTGTPTWVAVTTGLFGTKHSIVPADGASLADGALRVPVTREAVRTAPSPGDTQHLDPAEEARLREHYGVGRTDLDRPELDRPDPDRPGPAPVEPGPPAADRTQRIEATTPPPARRHEEGRDDGSMVRSEEQLRVSTEQTAATRVRVVRYVVTEEVQVTVPLRREEIRVEEVPLDAPDVEDETLSGYGRHAAQTDAGSAAGTSRTAGDGLPEEIVLHREEPVVGVRVVPVERVRLRTEVVQGQERVSGQVQRERIAVDETPVAGPAGRGVDRGADAGA